MCKDKKRQNQQKIFQRMCSVHGLLYDLNQNTMLDCLPTSFGIPGPIQFFCLVGYPRRSNCAKIQQLLFQMFCFLLWTLSRLYQKRTRAKDSHLNTSVKMKVLFFGISLVVEICHIYTSFALLATLQRIHLIYLSKKKSHTNQTSAPLLSLLMTHSPTEELDSVNPIESQLWVPNIASSSLDPFTVQKSWKFGFWDEICRQLLYFSRNGG